MAKNTQMSNLAVNTEADALAVLANGGKLCIYDGVQPTTGNTNITTQILLGRVTMGNPAFAAAVNGVLTANTMTGDVALNEGVAAWFRLFRSDGVTALWDGSVGTSDANLIMPSLVILADYQVGVATFTHTVSKSWSGH